ncbi:MAG: acyltransferase family protein, partial [Pseudomonadota bacterium]|nr:acyltransferase family protein [Pseudomonadota bacterium]
MNGLPRVATDCSLAIDPGISSYLDLFRTLAAVVVVLSHLVPNLFGIDVIPGHDAVMVFFVISGYVIAFAAENRDRTIDHFVVNRLARLWSVLLPSVLISAIAAITVGKDSGIIYAPAITDPGAFATAALLNAA